MNRKQSIYGLLFLVTVLLLLFAYYLEYWHNIIPCPLCLLQRFCFYILAAIFLVAFITQPKNIGHYVYGALIIIVAATGILIASRQLFLQHMPPDQTLACAADITYLLQTFPLTQVISQVFKGSAECAISQWSFFNLDMAGWALIWYAIFILFAIYFIIAPKRVKK